MRATKIKLIRGILFLLIILFTIILNPSLVGADQRGGELPGSGSGGGGGGDTPGCYITFWRSVSSTGTPGCTCGSGSNSCPHYSNYNLCQVDNSYNELPHNHSAEPNGYYYRYSCNEEEGESIFKCGGYFSTETVPDDAQCAQIAQALDNSLGVFNVTYSFIGSGSGGSSGQCSDMDSGNGYEYEIQTASYVTYNGQTYYDICINSTTLKEWHCNENDPSKEPYYELVNCGEAIPGYVCNNVSHPDFTAGHCEQPPVLCGNGILENGEECDDGNSIPFDGCTNCMKDTGILGTFEIQPGENLYLVESLCKNASVMDRSTFSTINFGDPCANYKDPSGEVYFGGNATCPNPTDCLVFINGTPHCFPLHSNFTYAGNTFFCVQGVVPGAYVGVWCQFIFIPELGSYAYPSYSPFFDSCVITHSLCDTTINGNSSVGCGNPLSQTTISLKDMNITMNFKPWCFARNESYHTFGLIFNITSEPKILFNLLQMPQYSNQINLSNNTLIISDQLSDKIMFNTPPFTYYCNLIPYGNGKVGILTNLNYTSSPINPT